jgi:hypothetical protein
MYYKLVSPRSNLVININYYKENKFGVDLVKMQTNIIDSPSIIVVFADKMIIFS